ncbi:hypothetical protein PMPD1_4035 [Paramixta manurensis]|uniref:Uncharacterized protein n=2 Tax=Paramixta manurensis TaxID=2740817 RepID=A0A6M8UUZ2_9GAMM|nr:hypothetical protein PMPD1_4035 [Erwiniaceae bacterium PD-1]
MKFAGLPPLASAVTVVLAQRLSLPIFILLVFEFIVLHQQAESLNLLFWTLGVTVVPGLIIGALDAMRRESAPSLPCTLIALVQNENYSNGNR